MAEFSLPTFAQTYVNTVKDRSYDLITHKIWSGMSSIDLKRWFNNFEGELEQYFAACILDALVFRSEEQLVSQARELFTNKICKLLIEVGYEFQSYSDLSILLRGQPNQKLRLVSVSNKSERPVKSSNLILRIYKRKLGFNENWFITPEEVKHESLNGIETFIFIDDFMGTGNQFYSMYKNNGFSLVLKNCNCIYAPLVAHAVGLKSLKNKCSEVMITSSETLDEEDNVFNYAFEDGINDAVGAKEFYDKILYKNKFNNLLPENKYGYGNLGLAYTFAHSSPDNCLHIIWDSQNGWHPLVPK